MIDKRGKALPPYSPVQIRFALSVVASEYALFIHESDNGIARAMHYPLYLDTAMRVRIYN